MSVLLRNIALICTTIAAALLLKGSVAGEFAQHFSHPSEKLKAEITAATTVYNAGQFNRARQLFRAVAIHAHTERVSRAEAMNWNNAGACSLALMQYGAALQDFIHARAVAEGAGLAEPLANTMNNMAALYLHTGQPENALQVALEGLKVASAYPEARAKLRFQSAYAMMQLNRFDEADGPARLSVDESIDQENLDTAARELGLLGDELTRGKRLAEAEWALSEGLRLTRTHHLQGAANILRGLAKLRMAQGDSKSAALLFDIALDEPPGLTPRWGIYMDRGYFRLGEGLTEGALSDFREARQIALQVRADMVPADQDRVTLSAGLGGLMEGLVHSGNLLATRGNDDSLLRETFDAAEQDRLWSLRALVPNGDDWRTRLPDRYWELLARYQAAQRASIGAGSGFDRGKMLALVTELQQIEAGAASGAPAAKYSLDPVSASPLVHIRGVLGDESVLFSFHVTKTSSWLWAVDKTHTAVYRLPSTSVLADEVKQFSTAIEKGENAAATGNKLYRDLFGKVQASFLNHKQWLLEPDGPLYEMPFAALVAGFDRSGQPEYLIERNSLQLLPGAMLAERGTLRRDGGFLGIGDPVYNAADPRFIKSGFQQPGFGRSTSPQLTLPRLPNTANELLACAREWKGGRTKLLSGADATLPMVQEAIKNDPSVIHFATHVVTSPEKFSSGLIALSLNSEGAMGLLGPREIVARRAKDSLVVMDGCHSSQGASVSGAGLMGLTRAWIGAGANAVVATQWDVPDSSAQAVMTHFYRALNRSAGLSLAAAMQQAQSGELHGPNGKTPPIRWAGYFLLSRI